MKINIRLVYLYLFSFVGLLITVLGCIRIVDLGLKVYVFRGADEYSYYGPKVAFETPEEQISTVEAKRREEENRMTQRDETQRQRKRELAGALSMIVVGAPLYLYHWSIVQKEAKRQDS